jgi:ribosomal protein L13E
MGRGFTAHEQGRAGLSARSKKKKLGQKIESRSFGPKERIEREGENQIFFSFI